MSPGAHAAGHALLDPRAAALVGRDSLALATGLWWKSLMRSFACGGCS